MTTEYIASSQQLYLDGIGAALDAWRLAKTIEDTKAPRSVCELLIGSASEAEAHEIGLRGRAIDTLLGLKAHLEVHGSRLDFQGDPVELGLLAVRLGNLIAYLPAWEVGPAGALLAIYIDTVRKLGKGQRRGKLHTPSRDLTIKMQYDSLRGLGVGRDKALNMIWGTVGAPENIDRTTIAKIAGSPGDVDERDVIGDDM